MSYINSTIGRKQLVGLAGLGLSLFVLVHMSGNLLVFLGPEAYNRYGHALTSNPLIYLAEAGLAALFLGHLVLASILAYRNRKARPSRYATKGVKTDPDFATKTLWFQGMVIFAFLIFHLITFKFGTYYPAFYDGVEMRDLYKLMEESFAQPLYVVGYGIVLLILGTHLGHGLHSSFQTLGLNGESVDGKLKVVGKIYAVVVTVGFLLPPLYIFFVNN